jgi:hypothetical protein
MTLPEIIKGLQNHTVYRKGHNYVGYCPYCKTHPESFVVSVSRCIFHCFQCGLGGPMPHTEALKQLRIDTQDRVNEACPPTAVLQVPSKQSVQARRDGERQNVNDLSWWQFTRYVSDRHPNIGPFLEMGQLTQMYQDTWTISFSKLSRVAWTMCNKHSMELTETLSAMLRRPMTVIIRMAEQ